MPGITGQPSQAQSGLLGLLQGLAEGANTQAAFKRESQLREDMLKQTLAERLLYGQNAADARRDVAGEYGKTREQVAEDAAAAKLEADKHKGGHIDPTTGQWVYPVKPPPGTGQPKNYGTQINQAVNDAGIELFGKDATGKPAIPQNMTADQAQRFSATVRNRLALVAPGADASKIPDYYTPQTSAVTRGSLWNVLPGHNGPLMDTGGKPTFGPNAAFADAANRALMGGGAVPTTVTSPGANPPPPKAPAAAPAAATGDYSHLWNPPASGS